jgi:cytochrome P450
VTAKLQEEVARVMGTGFDAARIKELTYLGAVINESMRLHPIATAVSRRLKEDAVFGGHKLPRGTIVSPSIYLLQRDARIWPDPTAFRPERFVDGKAPIYHFFPFGAGVWKCLGAQFAEYEMRVVMARLVQKFEFTRDSATGGKPLQRGFTVAPADAVRVRVSTREEGGHAVDEQRRDADRQKQTDRRSDQEVAKLQA